MPPFLLLLTICISGVTALSRMDSPHKPCAGQACTKRVSTSDETCPTCSLEEPAQKVEPGWGYFLTAIEGEQYQRAQQILKLMVGDPKHDNLDSEICNAIMSTAPVQNKLKAAAAASSSSPEVVNSNTPQINTMQSGGCDSPIATVNFDVDKFLMLRERFRHKNRNFISRWSEEGRDI